jgi:dTDP-4-dehydrorhamnose 3,5-epimerase
LSGRFHLHRLTLAGLVVIERIPIGDRRGFLERLFCAETFSEIGLHKPIVQINRTLTQKKATVRGMHFQHPPHAEMKIVSCLRGEVFDVAVDLRAGSATFLQWHGEILTGENNRSLFIPEGFAHGFQTLTAECELLYLHTANYAPQSEEGISPTDPRINIHWPLPVGDLSDRDTKHPPLTPAFTGISP